MPIGRYFFVVGSVLLALFFFTDWYYSAATATSRDIVSHSDSVDRSILRIRSDQRWPELIVIDTSQPTIVPPTAVAQSPVRANPPMEALAAMASVAAAPDLAAIHVKSERPKRQKIARHRQASSYASLQPANNWPTSPFAW